MLVFLKKFVEECNGEVSLVEDTYEKWKNKELTTIDELIEYPFKVRTDWGSIDNYTELNELLTLLYDGNRYEVIDLDHILEYIDDLVDEEEMSEEVKTAIHKTLIKEKIGSIEMDW